MQDRFGQLQAWLQDGCGLQDFKLAPASEDASFRRYFRVERPGQASLIVMDAPPDKENCRPFVEVAERLAAAGLHVPEIHAQDLEQGFLLLEDLGSTSYLQVLNDDTVERLYGDAMQALLALQQRVPTGGLPAYDRDLLMREMQLFPDWLLERHLGLELSASDRAMFDETFDLLADNALAQPVVCVHRDYHSRNLMVVDAGNPGVIDFQDAVAGPVTYDLVSLLRDCYVEWPASQVDRWVDDYAEKAGDYDPAQFRRWFDLMGVQRHLKAAGIFARLNHRDGKPGYLEDIPRTLGYIVQSGRRNTEMESLGEWLDRVVLPALLVSA